jgi:WD40 repeat protein
VLWDPASGEPSVLGHHDSVVTRIDPAADGRIATTGMDGTVRIWDLDRHELYRDVFADIVLRDRSAAAWDGQRGELRVTGDRDGQLTLRHDGEPPRLITRLPRPPVMMAMTSDGRHVVAADGQEIRYVDVETGTSRPVARHPQRPKQIVIDPTGQRAVIAGWINDVILVNLATGDTELRRGHEDALYQAVFDSRGERLVTASDDGTARVWDLDTGDTRVLRGHEDDVYSAAMTPDGRTVATVSLDGSARLWHIDDRKTTVVGQLGQLRAIRPIGGDVVRVVSISNPQRVIDVDLRERKSTVRYETTRVTDEPSISVDGSVVVFGHQASTVVWHDGEATPLELPSAIKAGDMAQDGRRAVLLLEDGRLVRWEDHAVTALPDPGAAKYVALSPDGRWMALVAESGVEIRDTTSGAIVTRLERDALGKGKGKGKLGVRFLPDNRRILVADLDGVRVWTWSTGELVPLVDSTAAHVMLEMSPDGSLLVGSGEGRTVQLWSSRTGAPGLTLRGHRDLVRAMAFSPDGRQLVTGSYDRTVRVWNLTTGESRVLLGHVGPVWAVAWLGPDRVVSAGDDGTVRLWQVPATPVPTPQQLIARLRAATTAEIARDDRPATPAVAD